MDTVKVDTRGGSIRVEVADNVGPLMAFRGLVPAQRCLASYADVMEDADVIDSGIEYTMDLNGRGMFYVPFLAYNRKVRR
jgi:hypothetical protein